jgi:hypothetical protein
MNYPNKYDITKLQLLHAYIHMDVLVVFFIFSKHQELIPYVVLSYLLGHSCYGQITINIQCDNIQIS